VTGLRHRCARLDKIPKGLMAATLDRDAGGNLVRKAEIMGVVLISGEVRPRSDSGRASFPAPSAVRPGVSRHAAPPVDWDVDGGRRCLRRPLLGANCRERR
jgi:hypothetical protein